MVGPQEWTPLLLDFAPLHHHPRSQVVDPHEGLNKYLLLKTLKSLASSSSLGCTCLHPKGIYFFLGNLNEGHICEKRQNLKSPCVHLLCVGCGAQAAGLTNMTDIVTELQPQLVLS